MYIYSHGCAWYTDQSHASACAHTRQVAVEPVRSHPAELASYQEKLYKLKSKYIESMIELWRSQGGPLKTSKEDEEELIDFFLAESVSLRAEFEDACRAKKARVFGGFHEDDLAVGEEEGVQTAEDAM